MDSVNRLTHGGTLSQSRQWDLQIIRSLPIKRTGVDDEGDAFLQLHSGEIFYSFTSFEEDRAAYRREKSSLPPELCEDAMNLAWDIAQRYCRENGLGYVMPKSHYLFPGWGFIDMGAFVGFGAMKAARKVGKHGWVLAIEASPGAFRLLQKNVRENGLSQIIPVHAAATDEDRTVEFFQLDRQTNSVYQSLRDSDKEGLIRFPKKIQTPGRSVDSLLLENGLDVANRSVFVSLEINGGEPEALEGMRRFIQTCPRYDIRAAARYAAADAVKSCADVVLDYFRSFEFLNVRPHHPYVIASRFDYPKEGSS